VRPTGPARSPARVASYQKPDRSAIGAGSRPTGRPCVACFARTTRRCFVQRMGAVAATGRSKPTGSSQPGQSARPDIPSAPTSPMAHTGVSREAWAPVRPAESSAPRERYHSRINAKSPPTVRRRPPNRPSMLHMLHTKNGCGKLWSMGAGDRFRANETLVISHSQALMIECIQCRPLGSLGVRWVGCLACRALRCSCQT
jgi:hypothetical protein